MALLLEPYLDMEPGRAGIVGLSVGLFFSHLYLLQEGS